MSPKFLRPLLLTAGCAMALSSCGVFKKDDPAPANDPYAAANPYATGAAAPANPAYPPANAYGAAAGAYDTPAAGAGYTTPNYNQPYVQPSAPPPATGAGYTGGYDSGAAAAPRAPGGSGRTHKVVAGDNLSKLAVRYGVKVDAIMRANHLQNANNITTGKTLIIP